MADASNIYDEIEIEVRPMLLLPHHPIPTTNTLPKRLGHDLRPHHDALPLPLPVRRPL